MRTLIALFTGSIFIFYLVGCGPQTPSTSESTGNEVQVVKKALFSNLSPNQTGITFANVHADNPLISPFNYVNAFNGGGVAIGDINNDGLADIYFTGNTVYNKLYLNKGNLQFEDITVKAGVDGGSGWSSGVTMADVNGDGFLDIYLCLEFKFDNPDMRENILYLNNGDLTFTNVAKEWGVADTNLSVQSTFLDYDNDGDLDLFLGNHPWVYELEFYFNLDHFENPEMRNSDLLFRNDGDKFTNVTKSSGILNYGFTLGVVSGDYNKDGWPDIYVANDHGEPDKLYLNNQNGTFSNVIEKAIKHTANFAMGVDFSDFNNDGYLDLVNVDMLAQDNYRQKTNMSGMAPKAFWRNVNNGYHYQYMRNMLQVNNQNGTFSEIGQLAGISQTDWSWTAFFADFNNSGSKDLYITNGYRLDARDNDFIKGLHHENKIRKETGKKLLSKKDWAERARQELKTTRLPNYFFENNGDYTFTSKASEAGLGTPNLSNGAAYGDLDNDGDLDLVVNNLQETASVYQNNSAGQAGHNSLQLKLEGEGKNKFGVGTKVTLKTGDQIQFQEMTHTRGFQSCVDHIIHFGLGDANQIDEVLIQWPDGREQVLSEVRANQRIPVAQKDAVKPQLAANGRQKATIFEELSVAASGVGFTHKENEYDDYKLESLLPHKMSQFGPNISVGDVDGDGQDDFFAGGAAGQPGVLMLAATGKHKAKTGPWNSHAGSEDLGSTFFDADGDGDLDLYIVSGGNEFAKDSPKLQDRLYLNDGKGKFSDATANLPKMLTSGACVTAADFDQDGDQDLFVGGRLVPGTYPFPARSYLLKNENGKFTDVTQEIAPDLLNPGLVTSAIWTDFDDDKNLDLILVGEWMPLSLFRNENGSFRNVTQENGLSTTVGWWNKVVSADFDGDGDQDLIAGNLGLNYKYKATDSEPFHIYCHDFDQSGNLDIVLGYFNQGTCYPLRGRQCSSEQMPNIKEKFPSYDAFAKASINDVYGENLKEALHYEANTFASTYFENKGRGIFVQHKLPVEAQFSSVNGILVEDFNGDGNLDALVAGNLFVSEVETGRNDAGTGVLLIGDGKGGFKAKSWSETGFFANLDVKDLQLVKSGSRNLILVANNDDVLQVFEFKSPNKGLVMR